METNPHAKVNDAEQNKAMIHPPVAFVTRKVFVRLDDCWVPVQHLSALEQR